MARKWLVGVAGAVRHAGADGSAGAAAGRGAGRSARRGREPHPRRQAPMSCGHADPGHLRVHPRHRHRLRHAPTASTPSTATCIDIATDDNLTEAHRRELRAQMIAAFPESQMLIFGPQGCRSTRSRCSPTSTAPTAASCTARSAEYNRLGIRVRYLLYPRTGPNTPSWTKAEQVWCSADRNDALTRAKLGQDLKTKPCTDNPVARSYALGQDFALAGNAGHRAGRRRDAAGYVPPDVLLKNLQDAAKVGREARRRTASAGPAAQAASARAA